MPKPRQHEQVRCQFATWTMARRNGVYYADGRSNTPPLGRHSLGTRDRSKALDALGRLDLQIAVQQGRTDASLLQSAAEQSLALSEGRAHYEKHVQRPRVAGGPGPSTQKRYRAVFDKFSRFASEQNILTWNQVTRRVLDRYAAWLESLGYEYATQYLELNTLKQALKFFTQETLLPTSCLFPYPMRKPQGTDTHCWTTAEVQAMATHCGNDPRLRWMRDVIIALAHTGLRISELASLRWSDADLDGKMLSLTDERTSKKSAGVERRTTKSGRSRTIPIHPRLLETLQQITRGQDERIFHGPCGGRLKPDTVRRLLIRDVLTPLADEHSTLTEGFRRGRLHSFRHSFCSTCANAGVPEQMLMNWLGHRNSRMVRHYYHLHDAESRRQMEQLRLLEVPDLA